MYPKNNITKPPSLSCLLRSEEQPLPHVPAAMIFSSRTQDQVSPSDEFPQ